MPFFTAILTLIGATLFGCTESKPKEPKSDAALFSYQGREFKLSDLKEEQQANIYDAQRRYHTDIEVAANEYITNVYLEDRAKKESKTVDQLKTEIITPAEPTEAEIKDFYQRKKDKIPYPYESIKSELKKIMMQDRKYLGREKLTTLAREHGQFKMLLSKPEAPIMTVNFAGRPEKGTSTAKITVVEFADYRCPHCGEAFADLKTLYPEFKDRIRFVFMDFPLQEDQNSASYSLARGAYCAHKQSKFWEYHDLAFEQQATTTADSPQKFATELKLDSEAFKGCFASQESLEHVLSSRREGERLTIKGTPTFFVNGKRVRADSGLKELRATIEAEL